MPIIKKEIKAKLDLNTFLYIAIGLLFISIIIFVVTISSKQLFLTPTDNLKQKAEQLAAGAQVPYSDPLIISTKLEYPKVLSNDPVLGKVNAKVTIFEYSDFLCEPCREQSEILKKVLQKYSSDEVRLVWKGTAQNAQGFLAEQAGYCAADQGKFWEWHDNIFADQNNVNMLYYFDLATKFGLNVDMFENCLSSDAVHQKVLLVNGEAINLGIDALPYFYIDNTPYYGVLSEDDLSVIIDSVISSFNE